KHLKEVTALIDARQFELITHADAGLVVIQGGAGSGKTTIGLHRLAYLAFRDPRRFRPDRMLVIVFNDALEAALAGDGEAGRAILDTFKAGAGKPLVQRFHALGALATADAGRALSTNGRVSLEHIAADAVSEARDVPSAWAELLTDRVVLGAALERAAPGAFTPGELDRAHAWCTARCAEV